MQTEGVSIHDPHEEEARPDKARVWAVEQPTQHWHRIALGAIVVLAIFLNFFQLQQNGYGNQYYAAAVRSMLTSWHNFFFVSFDPGGFVTVDKPPLGLWIQTASAAVFGFSGMSILLPQAVAGVLAVLVLYCLVQRTFGPIAGLLAALMLALTPISVVMNRDNNLDTLLVLTLLLAVWTVLLATETGRLRWLLLCALLVGLGFNIKTLEAYLVVPAFGALYLLAAPLKWRTRILHLIIATLVLLAISFVWIAAVDFTPASQRPYVGSSQTNSELELMLGYNGIERLLGFGGPALSGGNNSTTSGNATTTQPPMPSVGGVFSEGGPPSIVRLFTFDLGTQVSWLLPLAIIGFFALVWQRRVCLPLDRRQQSALLWGIWLLTMGAFFSVASFFHSYYLVIIAPAICALAAGGVVTLWQDYRERPLTDWRGWVLPLALLLTVAEQIYLLTAYNDWSPFLTPLLLVLSLGATAALLIARLRPSFVVSLRPQDWFYPAVLVGLGTLLLTPAIWSFVSTLQVSNATLPTGGPQQTNTDLARYFAESGRNGGQGGGPQLFADHADPTLVSYLETHQGKTAFLLATLNSMTAAPIIIETGKPVMAMGGFTGSDAILTEAQLATLVKNGTVRYFLVPSMGNMNIEDLPPELREMMEKFTNGGGGGPFGGFGRSSTLIQWVSAHCTAVPANEWQTGNQNATGSPGGFPGGPGGPGNAGNEGGFPGGPGGPGNAGNEGGFPGGPGGLGQQLYDCANNQA